MHEVVIAGIGQTAVGEKWDISLREMAFYALEIGINDAGGLRPQALYLANMLGPALAHQSHMGTLVADFAGLQGIEAFSVEAAGATGGVALRQAYLAVGSGAVDTAIVVGVEKMSDQTVSNVGAAEATLTDSDYEAEQGLTPTGQAALLMRRYIYEYDPPEYAFGGFPVLAHKNGAANKFAMFQKAIRPELYQRAGMVSEPLNMFDVAPAADGAAAVILTRPELLPKQFAHPLVRISGSSVVVDTLALHDRPDPLVFNAARLSAARALEMAGKTKHQIDLFELFDAYSIYAALTLEAVGYAQPGTGWQLTEDGRLELDGELPIMTFGGLKARGNPGGATGLYQAVEAVLQLRGDAGGNQVKNAQTALIQALGGPASTAASHVLESIS
ncbi:MAG: thiolase domain-containing protein [Anaerolineales bacterium]|nr:thiolase domain-containing protein [Anaerolineales bacterium]